MNLNCQLVIFGREYLDIGSSFEHFMHLFPLRNLLAKVLLLILAILDDELVADFLPVVLVIREVLLDLIKRLAL